MDTIKTVGFFKRLFAWGNINNQLVDAMGDLQRAMANAENHSDIIAKQEIAMASHLKDLQVASETVIRKDTEIEKLQYVQKDNLTKLERLVSENSALLSTAKSNEERMQEFAKDHALISEKNSNQIAENKRLSEEAATNTQTISDLGGRKGQLDIELAELKKELHLQAADVNEHKKQNTQLIKDDEYRR